MKRKGMVWTIDFLLGLMLFLLTLFIASKIMLGIYPAQDHIVVYRDAVFISDNLLSQGYPTNWNSTNVILPGIAQNNRINITQLSEFKKIEYYRTKTLLHVTSDYIFFIGNHTTILNTSQCIYGKNITTELNCTPILSTEAYNNLVRIDRLVIYNSTVMTLTVYAWN